MDNNTLPPYAYAISPYTNSIVRVVRGEPLFFGVKDKTGVNLLNAQIGVTPAQASAMYNGVLCGWDSPMADPKNYDAAGAYIGREMERDDG